MPTVHIFIWRLTSCVMPARQHDNLVVQAMPGKLTHHVSRKLRQECQIIGGIDDQRLLRPSRELLKVRHRTDGEPDVPQFFKIDLLLDPLTYMPRRLAVPDNVRKIS